MVLVPGKAGGAAPDGGTTGSGHSPATALCWTSFGSAQLQEGTCSILTPCGPCPSHTDRPPLGMDACVKSHQHTQGSWQGFWDQIRVLRAAGEKKKKEKWDRTAHTEGDEETAGRGADNGFGEEVRAQSIAPSPQDLCPSEERLKGSTPTGISYVLFPFSLAPTFWLQKQQILCWKFITCLYTKLPE